VAAVATPANTAVRTSSARTTGRQRLGFRCHCSGNRGRAYRRPPVRPGSGCSPLASAGRPGLGARAAGLRSRPRWRCCRGRHVAKWSTQHNASWPSAVPLSTRDCSMPGPHRSTLKHLALPRRFPDSAIQSDRPDDRAAAEVDGGRRSIMVREERRRGTLVCQFRPSDSMGDSFGVHEVAFRVNVRWVTPVGEETASTS